MPSSLDRGCGRGMGRNRGGGRGTLGTIIGGRGAAAGSTAETRRGGGDATSARPKRTRIASTSPANRG